MMDAAAREEGRDTLPVPFWALIVPPKIRSSPLRRTGWLTPYAAETLVQDAGRLGRGALLLVGVPSSTDGTRLAEARDQLARLLGRREIALYLRRETADTGSTRGR